MFFIIKITVGINTSEYSHKEKIRANNCFSNLFPESQRTKKFELVSSYLQKTNDTIDCDYERRDNRGTGDDLSNEMY